MQPLNLLPPEESRRLARRRVGFLSASVLVIVSFAGALEYLFYRVQLSSIQERTAQEKASLSRRLSALTARHAEVELERTSEAPEDPELARAHDETKARIEERLAALRSDVDLHSAAVKERQERLAVLAEYRDSGDLALLVAREPGGAHVLTELGLAAEGEVWFRSVQLTARGGDAWLVSLEGGALEMTAVRNFLDRLLGTGFEAKVESLSRAKQALGDGGPDGGEPPIEREIVNFRATLVRKRS